MELDETAQAETAVDTAVWKKEDVKMQLKMAAALAAMALATLPGTWSMAQEIHTDAAVIVSEPTVELDVPTIHRTTPAGGRGATTYYVDATAAGSGSGLTWDDAFTNLHDAFESASVGDTIRIAQGTYTPDVGGGYTVGNRNAYWSYGGGAVEGGYQGLAAPTVPERDDRDTDLYETVLSGEINDPGDSTDNSHRLLWTQTADETRLDGLTITGCYHQAGATSVPHAGFGGAISLLFGSSHTLNDLEFTNNYMVNDLEIYKGGAGLFIFLGSGTLTNSEFLDNGVEGEGFDFQTTGGALYLFTCDLDVRDCLFQGNFNMCSQGWGGAVYLEAGYQTFQHVIFRDNSVDGGVFSKGGAVSGWVNADRMGNSSYIDCLFEENFAQQGNCHWLWDSRDKADVETRLVVNSMFRDNWSTGSNGSAIFLNGQAQIDIFGSAFIGNSSDLPSRPNNIYSNQSGSCRIVNSTLTRDDPGWSVYLPSGLIIENTIIRGTSSGSQHPVGGGGVGQPVTISFSNIADVDLMPTDELTLIEVIDEDALFVDPTNGDYRLDPGSPCIDAADNDAVPADEFDLDGDGEVDEPIPFDLDGNPRFVDDLTTEDTGNPGGIGPPIVDMGGYEFRVDEEPCEGDANGDGVVDPLDSGFVLARFGCPVGTGDPNCDVADQNGDGVVDPLDSGFVLARFGDCP